jgi:hypothetical protein
LASAPCEAFARGGGGANASELKLIAGVGVIVFMFWLFSQVKVDTRAMLGGMLLLIALYSVAQLIQWLFHL